jgi:small RNA 2'-O-methyltransferase
VRPPDGGFRRWRRRRMTSWLHQQRIAAVRDAVLASGAASLLDLGCGDGDLMVRLVGESRIDRIVGIDICPASLDRLRARLAGMDANAAKKVDLIAGSMTEAGPDLAGFDCAVLLETIEHVDPDRLSALERAVFGVMRPRTVIVTTPNAEFNPLLGVPSRRLRRPDHRFEWPRRKFRAWAEGVAERNGFAVRCADIAGRHPELGGASQMAVFRTPRSAAVRQGPLTSAGAAGGDGGRRRLSAADRTDAPDPDRLEPPPRLDREPASAPRACAMLARDPARQALGDAELGRELLNAPPPAGGARKLR